MTMTDANVRYGTTAADFAGKLLSAARALDLSTSVVQFSPDGHFTVPEEVAEKAGVSYDLVESDEPDYVEGPEAEDLVADGGEPSAEDAAAAEDAEKSAASTQPAKVVVPAEGEEGYLAGKGLEAALKERGLPSTGKADDKRLAVATYDAEHPENKE
jgi:hypothetical protein